VSHRLRSLAIAGFLLLCIILGGSSQSPWTNLALQLLAICLLAWAAMSAPQGDHGKRAVAINLLLLCTLLVVAIQLVPLPASTWTRLPGRGEVARGLEQLGFPLGSAPISLMPWNSVMTLMFAIPTFAVVAATEKLTPSPRAIALAIVVGTIASVLVGAMQVAGGPLAWAYFYPVHNPGAVGFFANGNHMAALLLASIPMTAALVVTAKTGRNNLVMTYGIGFAVLALILIGIVLNGSRAAYGLALPVVIASLSLFPVAVRWRGAALATSVLALAVGVGIILTSPLTSTEPSGSDVESVGSRAEIWSTTAQAIKDSFPVGTGLGTFQNVYHRYENPQEVGRAYVNHAHNEYLEMVLELGAPGLVLIALFLAWWAVVAAKILTSSYSNTFARAATIATAVLLAQSIVDFPIRTAAMSTIFAACIGLMAQHLRPTAVPKAGEARPTRHVNLG